MFRNPDSFVPLVGADQAHAQAVQRFDGIAVGDSPALLLIVPVQDAVESLLPAIGVYTAHVEPLGRQLYSVRDSRMPIDIHTLSGGQLSVRALYRSYQYLEARGFLPIESALQR